MRDGIDMKEVQLQRLHEAIEVGRFARILDTGELRLRLKGEIRDFPDRAENVPEIDRRGIVDRLRRRRDSPLGTVRKCHAVIAHYAAPFVKR